MLVVTRNVNEILVLHEEATGKVIASIVVQEVIKGKGKAKSRVKIGIDAPPEVKIDRIEIYDRKMLKESS